MNPSRAQLETVHSSNGPAPMIHWGMGMSHQIEVNMTTFTDEHDAGGERGDGVIDTEDGVTNLS